MYALDTCCIQFVATHTCSQGYKHVCCVCVLRECVCVRWCLVKQALRVLKRRRNRKKEKRNTSDQMRNTKNNRMMKQIYKEKIRVEKEMNKNENVDSEEY